MTELTVAQIILGFAASLVAIALAGVLLRPLWLPLWHLFKMLQQFLEDWFGQPERPGYPGRPGAMTRLAQLETNSGTTMRDQIDRIEGLAIEAKEAAQQAVTAAGLAVNEAKVGRSVLAEAHQMNVAEIARTQGAVEALTTQVSRATEDARVKEMAYVRALSTVGIDLTTVADALLEDQRPQQG